VNVGKWQHNAPEVISLQQFPEENSTEVMNDESVQSTPRIKGRDHAIAVAAATAAATEAAVAAAQAAAKVVRLAGYGWQFREDSAATLIQAYYRGYLVSRFFFFLCKRQGCFFVSTFEILNLILTNVLNSYKFVFLV